MANIYYQEDCNISLLEGKTINEGTSFELSEDNEYISWVPFEPVTADNYTDYQ